MADLKRVRIWAEALIALHLGGGADGRGTGSASGGSGSGVGASSWTFGFDNAKTRAGQCNYSLRRITVSRYLAARYDDDEIHQVLLHEIAHAMAGSRSGHGPKWRAVAADLGYEGKRLHHGAIADELAPWVGTCPAGHTHYRYRKPARVLACGACSRRFDKAFVIRWEHRDIPASSRRLASTPRP